MVQGESDLFRELFGASQRLGPIDKGHLKVRRLKDDVPERKRWRGGPRRANDGNTAQSKVQRQRTAVRDSCCSKRYHFMGT
jgi:hypothetical protein